MRLILSLGSPAKVVQEGGGASASAKSPVPAKTSSEFTFEAGGRRKLTLSLSEEPEKSRKRQASQLAALVRDFDLAASESRREDCKRLADEIEAEAKRVVAALYAEDSVSSLT
jgi:hypothetical protein